MDNHYFLETTKYPLKFQVKQQIFLFYCVNIMWDQKYLHWRRKNAVTTHFPFYTFHHADEGK